MRTETRQDGGSTGPGRDRVGRGDVRREGHLGLHPMDPHRPAGRIPEGREAAGSAASSDQRGVSECAERG